MFDFATPFDLERFYLGNLLLVGFSSEKNREEPKEAVRFLSNYPWSHQATKAVFDQVARSVKNNVPLDVHTLSLVDPKDLPRGLLPTFIQDSPTQMNLDHFRKMLLDRKKALAAQETAARISELARRGVKDFTSEIASLTKNQREGEQVLGLEDTPTLVDNSLNYLEALMAGEIPTGFKTGLTRLDLITGGFHPGDLVIVGARPSMGKTAFALSILNSAIKAGKKSVFFSLEMTKQKVMNRLIMMNAKIPGEAFLSGLFTDEQTDRLHAFHESNYRFNNFCMSDEMDKVSVIKSKAEEAKNIMGGLDFVFIDYLSLIQSEGNFNNREREVAFFSSELKKIARDNNCVVVALSQLSRAVDSRAEKKPFMSDLRDSGSVEQDADLIMFLYRDDYYNPDNSSCPGTCEVLVSKNRNGETGSVLLKFEPKFMLFTEA